MTNNNRHITDDLLLSYLRNRVSEEQKREVAEWLNENQDNRSHLEKINLLWDHSAAWSSFENIDAFGDWQKVSERMGLESPTVTIKPSGKIMPGSLLRIAALAVILIGVGYLVFSIVSNNGFFSRQMAVITGKEKSTTQLPDGSIIHLNSNSELTYPKKFRKNSRQVELKGEAFFEVEPDAQRPFSVTSGNASVKVLGTSFNVYSVPENDMVTVSVAEGKVSFFPAGQEDLAILLKKGEQGIFHEKNLTKYDTVDQNEFSWKTGILKFDQSPLPEVIRSLEKHYNTIIKYQENLQTDPRLTTLFENQPLEEVLDELNLLLGLDYQQKNDTIFVKIE